MKGLIEWSEGDSARGRKLVLLSTVFVFLFITTVLFTGAIYGLEMSPMIQGLYVTLVTLMIAIYGFYTGTASDKTGAMADKAADIMMGKLQNMSDVAAADAKKKEEAKNRPQMTDEDLSEDEIFYDNETK